MKKLVSKPTVFVVTINGQDYEFAAITLRNFSRFITEESAATTALEKINVQREVVLSALNRAGNEATMEDILDMDAPLFNTLFVAVMDAHGMKLDAKLGELKPQ